MLGIPPRTLAIGGALCIAAAIAVGLTPRQKMADLGARMDLEETVPKAFGQWRIDPTIVPVALSPEVEAKLAKFYTQTLSRTYRNDRGERVMLSIAYGANQLSEATQVHRPEYCYAGHGFQIVSNRVDKLAVNDATLDVRRLIAAQPFRNEPITYWLVVGETATLPGVGRRMSQMRYGLSGRIPDGVVFRVSSIGADSDKEWLLQERFIGDLVRALPDGTRTRLVGELGTRS